MSEIDPFAHLGEFGVRFQRAFRAHRVPSIILRNDGQILEANRAAQVLLNYTDFELCKRRLRDITQSADHQLDEEVFQSLIKGEEPDYEQYPCRWVKKNGEAVTGKLNVHAVINGGNKVLFAYAYFLPDAEKDNKKESWFWTEPVRVIGEILQKTDERVLWILTVAGTIYLTYLLLDKYLTLTAGQ